MKTQTNGLGIVEVLLIVFLVLKLCKLIDWSWWWVLSPLWIGVIIIVILGIINWILNWWL